MKSTKCGTEMGRIIQKIGEIIREIDRITREIEKIRCKRYKSEIKSTECMTEMA